MIALDLESMVQDHGFETVTLALSVEQALAALAQTRFDVALVDYKLGEETAEPVVQVLAASGTALILVTGYDVAILEGNGLGCWPRLVKPITGAALEQALTTIVQLQR